MAYGTHASWAQFSYGMDFILLSRRLQWPLVALSLILCLALLGLVISGRRRAWWLIGLGPVLALFVHRFASDPARQFACVENPAFVGASEARHVEDDDWVVGLQFGDGHYAYPYAALFETPLVIHAEHDKRVAVMWSPWANRAVAAPVGRELRAAHVEVVSMPGNALLLYNGRLGQFINGATGRTPHGEKADEVGEPLTNVTKTTWRAWRERHPETKVLLPVGRGYATAPRGPIRPAYPLPPAYAATPGTGHVLVGVRQPVAFPGEGVTADPLNVTADGVPAVVFRDPADGTIRAFQRRLGDHVLELRPAARGGRRGKALFVDDETKVGVNAAGVAVEGPAGLRGKRLARVPVDDQLHFGVMMYAYRDEISYLLAGGRVTKGAPEVPR